MTLLDTVRCNGHQVSWAADELPVDIGDSARRRLWRNIFDATQGPFCDVRHAEDRPLAARFEYRRFGALRLARFRGTLTRVERTRVSIAGIDEPLVCLGINRGGSVLLRQGGREALLPDGQCTAVLWSEWQPSDIRLAPDSAWLTLDVPPGELLDRFGGRLGGIEARLARAVSEPSEVLRHLVRYVDLLFEPDFGEADERFGDRLAAHVVDLMALVVGVEGEGAALGRRRGLRAARLQAVIAGIKRGFANPGFSTRTLSARLGLSRRYIHQLLQESGTGFHDRVMELRLQKAHATLISRAGALTPIIDVAYGSGFSDVSYFNRCFRRRFGMTPSAARGSDRTRSSA